MLNSHFWPQQHKFRPILRSYSLIITEDGGLVNLFFAFCLPYFQIPSGKRAVQLGKHPVVFRRTCRVGGGLVVVPVGNGADTGGNRGQLPQGHISGGVPDDLLLHQRRVVVPGGAVSAEAALEDLYLYYFSGEERTEK